MMTLLLSLLAAQDLELKLCAQAPPGEEPEVEIRMRDVPDLKVRVSRVEFAALAEHLSGTFLGAWDRAIALTKPDERRLVREWTSTWSYAPERVERVKIPAREPGVYVVTAEHGALVRTLTLPINRYELVATVTPWGLDALFRERGTFRPVSAGRVRVVQQGQAFERATDDQGRLSLRPYVHGLLLGVNGGELVPPAIAFDPRATLPAVKFDTLWSHALESAAVLRASQDGRPPAALVSKFELRESKERDTTSEGKLPDLIVDAETWTRTLAFLEAEGGFPKAEIEKLKAARPDFTKDRVLTVIQSNASKPGWSRVSGFRGLVEDRDSIKVWMGSDHAGGGNIPADADRIAPRGSADLRFLRLPAGPKKVVVLDEATHTLMPGAPRR